MNKQCSICKETKSLDKFHKNRCHKDGFSYYCKSCAKTSYTESRKITFTKWYANNKTRISERKKKWYLENKEEQRIKKREYYQKNKEKLRLINLARYYKDDLNKLKQRYPLEYDLIIEYNLIQLTQDTPNHDVHKPQTISLFSPD